MVLVGEKQPAHLMIVSRINSVTYFFKIRRGASWQTLGCVFLVSTF